MSVWEDVAPHPTGDGPPEDPPGGGASLDLSILGRLSLSIDSLASSLRKDEERRDRREKAIPADVPLFGAGDASAAGDVVLDLGGVPLGRVWDVRRLIVGAPRVDTAPAGVAYIYATGASPSAASILDCVDIFLGLPRGDTWGTHQLYLLPGEHLWVVVAGGTPGDQYVASARAEEWSLADYFLSSTFAE